MRSGQTLLMTNLIQEIASVVFYQLGYVLYMDMLVKRKIIQSRCVIVLLYSLPGRVCLQKEVLQVCIVMGLLKNCYLYLNNRVYVEYFTVLFFSNRRQYINTIIPKH
jgi:hypothetical protein